MGTNSSLYEMSSIYMAGNNENDRVATSESVPFHRKEQTFQYLHLKALAKFKQ